MKKLNPKYTQEYYLPFLDFDHDTVTREDLITHFIQNIPAGSGNLAYSKMVCAHIVYVFKAKGYEFPSEEEFLAHPRLTWEEYRDKYSK